jgi:hypothetical protein
MTDDDREYAPRGPVELQQFFDAKQVELETLMTQVQEADELAEAAELAWIEHYDDVVGQLEEEDGRLPGEDQRVSIARRRGGAALWGAWRKAERTVIRMRRRAALIDNQIGAAQSEAKLLKER